jgi:hypothetical protein
MSKFNSDINPKNYYGLELEFPSSEDSSKNYQDQRINRGFDDTEVFSLDYAIVKFALPRIKRLLEIERNKCKDIPNFVEGDYFKNLEQIILDLETYDSDKTDLTLFFNCFKSLWY